MTNLEKYNNIFVEVFNADSTKLGSDFSKDTVTDWDSVHQLNIMALLEETFDIMLDPEDIVALVSYDNGKEVLKKYDINL